MEGGITLFYGEILFYTRLERSHGCHTIVTVNQERVLEKDRFYNHIFYVLVCSSADVF